MKMKPPGRIARARANIKQRKFIIVIAVHEYDAGTDALAPQLGVEGHGIHLIELNVIQQRRWPLLKHKIHSLAKWINRMQLAAAVGIKCTTNSFGGAAPESPDLKHMVGAHVADDAVEECLRLS